MRFFASMYSNPGFKTPGRGARWHRSYSDRATAPTQQPSPLTNGTPNASSGPLKPDSRTDGPRGPRSYTGHYYPPLRGRGPAYSYRPSPQDFPPPSTHLFGPSAPGPGHSHQQPTQFYGQGPPYTGPAAPGPGHIHQRPTQFHGQGLPYTGPAAPGPGHSHQRPTQFHGQGPPYTGPAAPGPGHSHQRPTRFHGQGPPYTGPAAPGPGHSHQRPTQFHGQGPPYTGPAAPGPGHSHQRPTRFHGQGPPYTGPAAPGPGHSHQRPTQFHGQGPPYTGPAAPGPGHSHQRPTRFHGQGPPYTGPAAPVPGHSHQRPTQFHGQGPPYTGPAAPGPGHSHQRPTQFHGQGPPYTGPAAPGPGHSHQRPTQFHGQGPPYTGPQQYYNQQQPPQWYRLGTPNGMYGQTNASQHKVMHRQPIAVNKLAMYMRKWSYPPSKVPPQCERFRLLSYNILADYLAVQHSNLYSHVPFYMLSWQWRMNNLLFEFQLWSPDVLCLQEVDRFPDLQIELESRGYSGIWKIRTGNAIDGCAIFWRTKRFKLLHHEYIEFRPIGLKDNVAQICVLESVVQRTSENDSSSTGTSSSRVVVCNIHVLFNPKRGDIKLGQVRTLIDQALAISKSWGDAPVVLCGDFNSTPNSPLYKFILEQKLDLSGLVRSQISGQETGNALASVPGHHKFPRSSSSIDTVNGNRESTDQNAGTGTGTGTGACTTSSSPVHTKDPDLTEEAQSSEKKGLTLSTESDATEISDSIGNDHVTEPIQDANVPLSMDFVAAQGLQELGNDSSDVISSNYKDPLIEKLYIGEITQSKSLVEDDDDVKGDFINTTDSIAVTVKQPEETHSQKKNETICTDFDASKESQEPDYATTSTNSAGKNSDTVEISQTETLGGDFEIFKGNCVIDSADEENPDPNFLSELQGTQDEFGFKWTQDEFASETNYSPEIIGGSSNSYPPYSYDPYKWTPDELRAATGSEDCTFVEHGLKLRSVYTDVEDHDGTKGPHGEPEATSYNQNFLGTVDYIWSSEGLKTVRVLDTIPKHILQETKGFPTKKWGSDHIALVCELAFTNG